MIGDREHDVHAGLAAGLEGYLLVSDESLSDVIDAFLARQEATR